MRLVLALLLLVQAEEEAPVLRASRVEPEGYEVEDSSSNAGALHRAALDNWRIQTSQASRIYPREFGYSSPNRLMSGQDYGYFVAPADSAQTSDIAKMVEQLAQRFTETLQQQREMPPVAKLAAETAAVADSVAAPVEGFAQTASRWSNIATEGWVNGANFMNTINHRFLDRFLDVMQVADRSSRAVAFSETDLMRRMMDSQLRFLDSMASLNERIARRGTQLLSQTSETLAEAGMTSIDLSTLLDSIVEDNGGALYV